MKQTAVDWLKDMLEWNYGDPKMLEISWVNLDDLFERAKQMEKEQIIQSHIYGQSEWDYKPVEAINKKLAEDYYKQNYRDQ